MDILGATCLATVIVSSRAIKERNLLPVDEDEPALNN